MKLLLLLLVLAQTVPIWEEKAPEAWTDDELEEVLQSSPWALRQPTVIPGAESTRIELEPVHFFLASADPMQMAEAELRRRTELPPEAREDSEFRDFLRDNSGEYIVLAVKPDRPRLLEKEREVERMEKKSTLQIGKRKYKTVGHFPPTGVDPYLRLVFEKEIRPGDAKLQFDLYLPGVPMPFRHVEFNLEKSDVSRKTRDLET